MPNHIDAAKADFQGVLDHYQKELTSIRTGRASVAMIEHVRVEAYGSLTDLKSVASMTTPDAKTIQIEPWDKTMVKGIEKALVDANLGMMPNVAGTVIRLVVPPMTEEGRKNMVKMLNQKAEAARIGVRNVREKVKTAIVADEKAKTMSEDEKRGALEQLDKVVADWNGRIDAITKEKEAEVMTV